MTAEFLGRIDWSRPWLTHVRTIGQSIADASDWRIALNERAAAAGLLNRRGMPIRFVPQTDLPAKTAYETFIHETGGVPTRENLHDFFNALVWLTFPQIKVLLNALQAAEIEKSLSHDGIAPRGKVRDAVTIFDENAVLLVSSNSELVDALRAHAWIDVFLTRRGMFKQESDVFLFGHALMEKLVAPYKSITGHMWVIRANRAFSLMSMPEQCRLIDSQVADQIKHGLATSDFSPLPILGIPDWWAGQDEHFYLDASVFRPKR